MHGTGSVDADTSGLETIELYPLSVGPFLVDVPAGWEIVDYPDERVTVVREPTDPDDPLVSIPGYVIPNVAFRFFEAPAAFGSAARSATQEAAATYDQVPGAVLLAVSPFTTVEGLPGRAHMMTGIQDGIPFMSSRWHVGDGTTVLEVTLTGPGTPMPDLMELGQHIADSVRTTTQVAEDVTPVVTEDLQDRAMMDVLTEQSAAAKSEEPVPGLESVALILAARAVSRPVPATVPVEPDEWASLLETAQGGLRGRLIKSAPRPPHPGLVQAGLATRRRLTERGSAWGDLAQLPPALIVRGRRFGRECRGEVRLDGMDCLVTLDQPFRVGRDADPSGGGTRLVGAFLTLALPPVLLDWCGLRADWFADLRASGPATAEGALSGASGNPGSAWVTESGGAVMEGILAGASTRWTVELADGQSQLAWFQPDERGPMLVYGTNGGDRIQAESTTGLVLYDSLSRLIRDVARSQAATVKS